MNWGCPTGSTAIDTLHECRDASGGKPVTVLNDPSSPGGCFWTPRGGVQFNGAVKARGGVPRGARYCR